MLVLLAEIAEELRYFSCELFREFAPKHELSLPDNSNERWTDWDDFNAERRRHIAAMRG